MAGGGGGGQSSGGGGGTGLDFTQSADFSQNAMNTGAPGGQPGSPDFVNNAFGGGAGGSPAAVVGGPNDPTTQASLSGLYASTVNPATTPTGQSSGQTNPMANLGEQIGKLLFGSQAQAATPSRPGGPAGSDAGPGAGWFSTQPPARAGTDPYGNTYTTAPDYQASPISPLPPYRPQAGATPAPAPARAAPAAPAAQPPAQPAAQPPAEKADGGGKLPEVTPTPSKANQPEPPPEEVPLPRPRPDTAPGTFNQAGEEPPPAKPSADTVFRDPLSGLPMPTPPAPQPAAPAAETPRETPVGPIGDYPGATAEREGGNWPFFGQEPAAPAGQEVAPAAPGPPAGQGYGGGATVSPQSAIAPGEQRAGGWQADPNSYIGRLLNSQNFGEFIGNLLGQQGLPASQNMAATRPQPGDTGRITGTPIATQPVVPPDVAREAGYSTAGMRFQPPWRTGNSPLYRNPQLDPLTAGVAGTAPEIPTRPAAPADRGGAAATAPATVAPGANLTPKQWDAGYQKWLQERGLPDNAGTRTRFNIEYGRPKNEGVGGSKLYNQATPEQQRQLNEPPQDRGGAGAAPAQPPATPQPGEPWPQGRPPPTPGPLFEPGDPRAPQWYRDRTGSAETPETLGNLGGVNLGERAGIVGENIRKNIPQLPYQLGQIFPGLGDLAAKPPPPPTPGSFAREALTSPASQILQATLLGPMGAARLGRTGDLNLARAMEAGGFERQQIMDATGFGRNPAQQAAGIGGRGRWMGEISDVGARVTLPKGVENLLPGRSRTGKLSEFFNHPELYKAYPHLADTKVTIRRPDALESRLGWSGAGSHDPKTGNIEIVLQRGQTARQQIEKAVKETLVHEAGGHAVSAAEGFDPGRSLVDPTYRTATGERSAYGTEAGMWMETPEQRQTFFDRMQGGIPFSRQTVQEPLQPSPYDAPLPRR